MSAAVGKGTTVSGHGAEGELRSANDVQQVMDLLKHENLDDVVLLCESASATAIVPLLAKVKAVICLSGGETSHLAIVSREFGLPAVMGASVEDPAGLEGKRVQITADGEIALAQ